MKKQPKIKLKENPGRQDVDWFKAITGRKLEHFVHDYSFDPVGYANVLVNSKLPPITLGYRENGDPFFVSFEQMQKSMQFKAPSGKGKSTSVLGLIRDLVLRSGRVIFFDESYKGDSAYKLLHFCQAKKLKHILIDLNRSQNPVFDFFHRETPNEKYRSIAYLTDAFKVLFSVKDLAETPQIAQYLEAILHILYNAGLTLAEAKYFTVLKFADQRKWILDQCKLNEKKAYHDPIHRYLIESVMMNNAMFTRFLSTMARLSTLNHPALQALCGDKPSVHVKDLFKEKYIIIVVLAVGDFNELQRRLYGTLLINEFLFHHDQQSYWMFIDEAQDYATSKLGDILDKRAKSNLYLGLLHHHMSQFEDLKLRTSVHLNTPIKFEFEKKQEATVTLNEMEPLTLWMPEVKTTLGTWQSSGFNRNRNAILKNIDQRIPYDPRKDTTPVKPGTAFNQQTTGPDYPPEGGGRLWEDLSEDNEGFRETED